MGAIADDMGFDLRGCHHYCIEVQERKKMFEINNKLSQ
jgi:hypothetical protein